MFTTFFFTLQTMCKIQDRKRERERGGDYELLVNLSFYAFRSHDAYSILDITGFLMKEIVESVKASFPHKVVFKTRLNCGVYDT